MFSLGKMQSGIQNGMPMSVFYLKLRNGKCRKNTIQRIFNFCASMFHEHIASLKLKTSFVMFSLKPSFVMFSLKAFLRTKHLSTHRITPSQMVQFFLIIFNDIFTLYPLLVLSDALDFFKFLVLSRGKNC